MKTSKPYKLVVPLAGRGQRMIDGGYKIPKPMLICGDKSILEWSMQSIDYSECELEFVVREEHVKNFGMFEWLQSKFGKDIGVTQLKRDTRGAIETVLAGINGDDKNPLIVLCPDVTFYPVYKPEPKDFDNDGLLLTFKSNSPNYSYSLIDSTGYVGSVWEKVVLPNSYANVGVYCFSSCELFSRRANDYLSKQSIKTQYNPTGEAHIAPLYNHILNFRGADNGRVAHRVVDKIHIMGTPEEFKFCEDISFKYYVQPRSYALCSDHSGLELKEEVKKILDQEKINYIDFGTYNNRDCDYNVYVNEVCKYVLKNKNFFGLGMCRSGQGINICANKYTGIRSALIQDEYHAEYAIRHNAANFFSLSAYDLLSTDDDDLRGVIDRLTYTTFDGGRHQTRLMQNNA